jgi:hypothetical protein
MRRAVAAFALAAAACASAPPPNAPANRSAPPAPQPPPPPTAQELADRIVKEQPASTRAELAPAFTYVHNDLVSEEQARVVTAIRVMEEICVLAARSREPMVRRGHELLLDGDGLAPLVKRIDELLGSLREAKSCTTVLAAARATVQLDRVPRTPRGVLDRGGGTPLSKRVVICGMNAIRDKVAACYAQYQIPGTAMVNLVVNREGTVIVAVTTGKFAGTPTGECVAAAAKTVSFGPSSGFSMTYPFVLK